MKTTIHIKLNSDNDVKDFVNLVSKYSCDFDLVSGRYVVDAKSIMGVLSLYLAQQPSSPQPIALDIHTKDDTENVDDILEALKPYTAS